MNHFYKNNQSKSYIFPNPLKDGKELNVKLDFGDQFKFDFKIYNLLGKRIQFGSVINSFTGLIELNNQLQDGQYIVILKGENQTLLESFKLLVL